MSMFSYSALITENQKIHSLKNALFINDYELNQIGKSTLELFDDSLLKELHSDMSWLIQSIWEFQDLQSGRVFINPIWMKQGYCFFESVNVLRDSILVGLNSYYHVSISGLRSAFELILLHSYWESNKDSEDDLTSFSDWIEGKVSKLPFKTLLKNLELRFALPPFLELPKRLGIVYGKLCSYAHTPIISESFTRMKQSNLPTINKSTLRYWMNLYNETLRCLLDLLIVCYPMSLFPVNLLKKFGFNPPAGLFFDEQNCRPLKQVVGIEEFERYRDWFFTNNFNISGLLDWFNGNKNLSIKEVKDTWSKDERHTKEYKKLKHITSLADPELETLMFLTKLKIRVIQMQLIYKDLC